VVPNEKPTPDTATILAHLEHITRRWHELNEPVLLETVHLTNGDKAEVKDVAHFRYPDQIRDAADHIAAMNPYNLNSYATVNPVKGNNRPPAGKRASAEHIAASFYHWADADSEEAARNIKSFVGPKPTLIVITGSQPCARPHTYWELETPTDNWPEWTARQRAIAATLKTDPAVIDAPRIMRVAGTVNWPKPKKQAKGYVAEQTTLHILRNPPVSADSMARAFVSAPKPEAPSGDWIDQGGTAITVDAYADILRRAQTEGEKHTGVRDLTAKMAAAGVPRNMTEAMVRSICPVWDENVETLIETAYAKYYHAPEPPVEVTPQTIQDFRIDSSADFLSDLQPLEYLIDGILPSGVAYSLTGHAGHGKTTLALQIALAVARGEDFGGRETSKGSVLILAGENPYNVKWQYAAALAARSLRPEDVDVHFVQGRFSISQWTEVLRAKMEAMPDLKLVIVDSLQAFFEGDNDNDNTQMVEMAHRLRAMCQTSQRPALLIIAHPAGKTPTKDNLVPRGGGAFLNEIDGNLTVWSQDASQQTLHHSPKFRGASFDPMEWVMQVHEFDHLTDIHGTPLKLPVSRPEMVIERATREQQNDTLLRRYLETVDAGTPLSVREGASQFGVSRWRMQQIVETAKEEKLIRRYAKTFVLTEGGKDFLEARNAGF
jgi:hypothetical protein